MFGAYTGGKRNQLTKLPTKVMNSPVKGDTAEVLMPNTESNIPSISSRSSETELPMLKVEKKSGGV